MRWLIVVAALALSACGGGDKDPGSAPAAPDAASNFSQPIDARATDGSWGLTIRGQQLTLTRPNQPDLVGTAPGATIQAHEAAWAAILPNGATMKVSVYASACTNPGGGPNYPFSVEVILPGASPLIGCGGSPAAPKR